jgi:glutathionyl-hydroquinone reductase
MPKLIMTKDQKDQLSNQIDQMGEWVYSTVMEGNFLTKVEKVVGKPFEEMNEDELDSLFEYLNKIEGDLITDMLVGSIETHILERVESNKK